MDEFNRVLDYLRAKYLLCRDHAEERLLLGLIEQAEDYERRGKWAAFKTVMQAAANTPHIYMRGNKAATLRLETHCEMVLRRLDEVGAC